MKKYRSAKHYVLSALIPYTEPNLKLAFKPNVFFSDLARLQNIKENTARNAFYRATKNGLIEIDERSIPRLTDKGRHELLPYQSKKMKDAYLMVTFDIPEVERWKRRHLRSLLRELSFVQVQKSVWVSKLDHREYLRAEIEQLGLHSYVQVYECRKI